MNKKVPISFIMSVILVISLVFNVINLVVYNQSYSQSRQMLINHLYYSLQQSVSYLDDFLDDSTNNTQQLENAGTELIKLDTIINENTSYYKNPLYYPGILSFSFIAGTLMYSNENIIISGLQVHSVLYDKPITNNELTYVKTLRDDLDSLVSEMSDYKDKNNANESLSIAQVNYIMDKFYDRWSRNITDSSPYRLLIN